MVTSNPALYSDVLELLNAAVSMLSFASGAVVVHLRLTLDTSPPLLFPSLFLCFVSFSSRCRPSALLFYRKYRGRCGFCFAFTLVMARHGTLIRAVVLSHHKLQLQRYYVPDPDLTVPLHIENCIDQGDVQVRSLFCLKCSPSHFAKSRALLIKSRAFVL